MTPPALDAIVIGSGAGGAAVTYKMIRAGLRVALLEKGPRLPNDGSTLDIQRVVHQGEFLSREPWLDRSGDRIMPEEHFNLGGKTKWYGAALLRFSPHEFAADTAHGCLPWPLSYRDIEAYYVEAERMLAVREFSIEPDLKRLVDRITGTQSGWRAEPMPMGLAAGIVHDVAEARHFDGFASVRSLKSDAEQSLLARIAGDPRLTLLTGTEVVSLIGDPGQPERVAGVRTADGHRLFAPSVVLAGGAMHSPRLLQRYLESSALATRLPAAKQLGRNLKLHLLTAMVALSPARKSDLIRKTTVLLNARYPHCSVQPLGFDSELLATLIPSFVPRTLASAIGERAYGFFLQTEDGSHTGNRIVDAPQPGGLPTFDYDESRTPAARKEHRAFTRALQRALLRAGCVSFTKRIGITGTAHVCGTMVCGQDSSDSVVDANGAVHGMRGIFVADGSILPRSSRVNPALTIYAWGLRLGDFLARQRPLTTTANAEFV